MSEKTEADINLETAQANLEAIKANCARLDKVVGDEMLYETAKKMAAAGIYEFALDGLVIKLHQSAFEKPSPTVP